MRSPESCRKAGNVGELAQTRSRLPGSMLVPPRSTLGTGQLPLCFLADGKSGQSMEATKDVSLLVRPELPVVTLRQVVPRC